MEQGNHHACRGIVIVDDDEGILAMLATRCESLGLSPRVFVSLNDAVRSIHDQRPGMMILDVNVGRENGLITCEGLALSKRVGCIPVIVITGATCHEYEARAKSVGAQFVRKGADLWKQLEPLIVKHFGLQTVGGR